MIIGAHTVIYSKDPEADREFFRDVLRFPSVDAGHGWLIFGLPPSEVAVHPSDENDHQEFYMMCEDIRALVRSLREEKIGCSDIRKERWGSLTHVDLPGGGKLGVYQPKHLHPSGARRPRARREGASARKVRTAKGKSRARPSL